MPRLVVLDALGLAYRAYYALARWGRNDKGERHAYPALSNSRKEPTNAIYGMANLFVKFRRELKPDRWALAWDGPGPTFRHELYPRYKEHRPEMPAELSAQLTPIEDLARCMGLPVLEKAGMEADDVMATLSRIGADAGYEVLLITGDKDMLQLVDESVMVLSPQAKGDDYARLDAEGVRAKWGVPPEQIRDVLALMGDATDGYPGVPGVGEKTAVELLTTFGSVDAMYERLAEIKKPALAKKLAENKALAYLSRELATVRRDLDLGISLDDLAVAPIRRDELMAFAKRWEVRRLEQVANDLGVADAQAGAPVPQRPMERRGTAAEQSGRGRERASGATTATVDAPSQPDLFGVGTIARPAGPLPASRAGAQGDLFASMNAEAGVDAGTDLDGLTDQGLDGLTNRLLDGLTNRVHEVRARALHGLAVLPIADGDSPRRAKLVGVAFAARSGHHCYVPLAHEAGPNVGADQLRDWFGAILIDPSIEKVAHDWKRALHELAAGQVGVSHPGFDVRLGSFLCDPQRDHSILALAGDVLGVGLDALEAPVVRGRPRPGLAALDVGAAAARAGRLAAALLPLADALRAQLEAREQWKLYKKLEHPLIGVLVAMERAGIALDPGVLRSMSAAQATEIAALETKLHALAGEPVNLASGPQLGRLLFEKLQLPTGRKTKTGWSTDSEVLEALAPLHEFPRLLLAWRALTKLKSTYVDALPEAIDPGDQRVHTTFDQAGAATGRLASLDPNLQNIPIRTAQGREIRRAFVAAPGCVLVGADYSQIELRVMAHLSGDPNLVEAFAAGEDIHAATARRIFKVAGEVPPELRARAKIVNFGVLYGMGARSLAQQMGLELKDAKEFIDGYFSVYAGVRRFLDATLEEARSRGWVATLLGRRRYLPELRSTNGAERSFAERAAINTPIQGSAADLVKLAMLSVHRALANRTGARLLLQVHDELLVECPQGEAEGVTELVRREMQGCYPLNVPLTVSVGTGRTWFDVH
ncbi:MAG TPA: DNA polymerase I [Methylomirabilota bacterium]|nr:DNA polymerase I [Methylomirabilota bacterium]